MLFPSAVCSDESSSVADRVEGMPPPLERGPVYHERFRARAVAERQMGREVAGRGCYVQMWVGHTDASVPTYTKEVLILAS